MKKNKISKTVLLNVGLVLAVIMLGVGAFFATKVGAGTARELVSTCAGFEAGEYITADGAHKISVETNDGGSATIFYCDTAAPTTTYALTANTATTAGVETTTLTGKLGTSNTDATFVMLNENAILCVSHIKYATASGNVILYGYTPFVKEYEPIETTNGVIEVWRASEKVGVFANFQDAFAFAQDNDTLKLKSNLLISEGAVLVGKTLTIEGNNHTLDKSQWANTVFAVAEGAQLTINNLNIDGGATGWAADIDSITSLPAYNIPFVANSANNDPRTNYSAITIHGTLLANNLNVSNIYSEKESAAITLVKGDLQVSNSDFRHNVGTDGGAVRLGLQLLFDQIDGASFANPMREHPVQNASFTDVNFINNATYKSNGAAIGIKNIKQAQFEGCTFDSNANLENSWACGGAIVVFVADYLTNHTFFLPFTQVKINNSVFNNNWTTNDGFAIENRDAEFTITNTRFSNNVGTRVGNGTGGDSIGVFSYCAAYVYAPEEFYAFTTQIFDNCIFENNMGAVSCIGDHETPAEVLVSNTSFINNKGATSVLLYTGVGEFDNCIFDGERVTVSVMDIRTERTESYYENLGKSRPILKLNNTTFTNTPDGINDIRTRHFVSSTAADVEIIVEGESEANIFMTQGSSLTVNGKLDGNVTCAADTPSETNVTTGENGVINGDTVQYYNLTINYLDPTSNANTSKTISVASGTTTSYVIEALLGASKDNHTLVLYTDSICATAWDYNCDQNETLYGAWQSGAIAINYYDQGGIRFSGTHSGSFAQNHLNGMQTILDTPTKGGCIFEGWYLGDSTCSDESKRVTQLSASETYESVSLYAKWRVFVQTITLTCQNYDAGAQQFMVYVFIGEELVMQVQPTETITLTFNRLKNYEKTLRICFVYGYYGQIEYTSLTGAKDRERNVYVSRVETVQIDYKITTPRNNANIVV